MHTLVVSRIFTLWMFAESVVDGALTISYSGSNVIGSTTYSLKCEVPGFSGQAVWNIGGTTSITCLTSVCIPASSTPYTFRQNGTAIYADFSVLAATEDDIQWSCQHATDTTVFFKVEVDFGTEIQTSTSLSTERTTGVNNITTSITHDSISSTRDISISTISYLHTATSNLNANIETSNLYTNTDFYGNTDTAHSNDKSETANLKENIESTNDYANSAITNFFANTEIDEIQTDFSEVISNTISQSLFVTTVFNAISGSLFPNTKSKNTTEIFASPSYSVSSDDEITLPPAFETKLFLFQTFSETSWFYSMNTQTDILPQHFSSVTPITTDSFIYHIMSMATSQSHFTDLYTAGVSTFVSIPNLATETETVKTFATPSIVNSSALNSEISEHLFMSLSINGSNFHQIFASKESLRMSTTSDFDQTSHDSKMIDPSFPSYQNESDTTVIPNYNKSSRLPLSTIDIMDHFTYTTNNLVTSYMDDTSHSFGDLTGGFQAISQDHPPSASPSFLPFFQSTDYSLFLQTTEYHATMQTASTSYVNTSYYESVTDNAATGIYSTEIVTSGKFYTHISVMPSQTQRVSMKDIQDSTTEFQSTNIESDFQSTAEDYSSEISEHLLSTLQSTSLLLPFDTKANASEVDLKTTDLTTFESLSGILTTDESLLTNPFSILISNVLPDFRTISLTTTVHLNSKTMPPMINPSSQETNSDNSYIKIDTSFKDPFSLGYFSGFLSSNYPVMTSLSSRVLEPISTLSTITVQSGLAEKNKNIIFITTISAILIIITVILSIIFAKVYMPKHNEEDSKRSSPPEPASPNYSFTGKIIYPMLITSTTSLKIQSYERNWNDVV